MKKKAARRKLSQSKKPPKPSRELHHLLPDRASREQFERMVDRCVYEKSPLEGISLPEDLDLAIGYFAHYDIRELDRRLKNPPIFQLAEDSEDFEEAFDPIACSDAQLQEVENCVRRAIRKGFYLALLRYRDDLKHVPEAAALLEKKRSAAKKGGAARRKLAEPNHKAIRKRFRELRKTVPKKTARYVRVAGEFEMSDRQIARIVDGID